MQGRGGLIILTAETKLNLRKGCLSLKKGFGKEIGIRKSIEF